MNHFYRLPCLAACWLALTLGTAVQAEVQEPTDSVEDPFDLVSATMVEPGSAEPAAGQAACAGCDGPVNYGCCNSSCCNGSCCNNCCSMNCNCCPLWTVRGGLLAMWRSGPAANLVVAGAPTNVNAADLSFSLQAGWEVSAIRTLNNCWSLEARYLQIDGWVNNFGPIAETSSAVATPSVISVIGAAQNVSGNYRSLLRSAELNGRRQLNDWLTGLAGFRYLNVQESLTVVQDAGGIVATHVVGTQNHLFGGQLGLDGCLVQRGRGRIDAFGKAGIYGNAIENSGTSSFTGVGVGPFPFARTAGQVAFVGEIAVTGSWCYNDHITLRGGYQMLWLQGLALASDQFNTFGANFPTTGGIFAHGFMGGLEFSW